MVLAHLEWYCKYCDAHFSSIDTVFFQVIRKSVSLSGPISKGGDLGPLILISSNGNTGRDYKCCISVSDYLGNCITSSFNPYSMFIARWKAGEQLKIGQRPLFKAFFFPTSYSSFFILSPQSPTGRDSLPEISITCSATTMPLQIQPNTTTELAGEQIPSPPFQ